MPQKIKERTSLFEEIGGRELRFLFDAVLADNAALRVDILAQATAMDVLATKLNADAGVSDTDYATTNVAAITSTTPSLEA